MTTEKKRTLSVDGDVSGQFAAHDINNYGPVFFVEVYNIFVEGLTPVSKKT